MITTPPPRFAQLLAKAFRGGAEVTLRELITALEFPSDKLLLDCLADVSATVSGFGLLLVPGLEKGDFDTCRILREVSRQQTDQKIVRAEIDQGETDRIELKSSFNFDHKKAAHNPSLPSDQCRSEEVANSCLKTVAAFLNSRGGILYVGVDDHGKSVGISFDLASWKKVADDIDYWQLRFRSQLETGFKEGAVLNDYVQIEFLQMDGTTVARIVVSPRRRLSFMRSDNAFRLYRRQGNRTAEVKIENIEDFLLSRAQASDIEETDSQ